MKLSEMTVDQLRQTPWFHLIDPGKLNTLDEYAEWLEAILHNPCEMVERDGELFLIESKPLVARVDGLRIEIYPGEHPPPHFHVKSPDLSASLVIDDCRLLAGKIDARSHKKIRYWHNRAKPLLIAAWDSTRPTHCQVGRYRGP